MREDLYDAQVTRSTPNSCWSCKLSTLPSTYLGPSDNLVLKLRRQQIVVGCALESRSDGAMVSCGIIGQYTAYLHLKSVKSE